MRRLISDDTGATMVEYGIMVSLVAAVAYLAVRGLGPIVASFFESMTDLL